jgi:hypothetical protein
MFLLSPFHPPWSSSFRNPVLFFKARFETFQIYRNPWLRLLAPPSDIAPATRLVAPVLEPLVMANTDRAKTRAR